MNRSSDTPLAAPVNIELLGRLGIVRDGAGVTIPRGKTAALLAKLAYEVGREHSRDALVELLWPEADLESGRVRLRTVLSDLRALLEPDAALRGAVVTASRDSVALRAGSVRTDVAEFLELLDRAKAAPDARSRAGMLEAAAERYTGELLPSRYEDWVLAAREHLAQRHTRALAELATCREQLGELESAIEAAAGAVRSDPLSEEAHCLLMRLHLAAGRPAAVLRQYAVLERSLQQELELEPSEAARRLAVAAREANPPALLNGGDTPVSGSGAAPGPAPAAEAPVPVSAPPTAESAPISGGEARPIGPPYPSRSTGHGRRVAAAVMGLAAVLAAGWLVGGRARLGGTQAAGSPAPFGSSIQWIARYPLAADEQGSDSTALSIDPTGNVCIAGFAQTKEHDVDFLTLRYSPQGGLLWRRRYNGAGNDVDRARCITTDMAGNVYVAGDAQEGRENGTTRLSGLDVVLIKYAPDGRQLWVRRWDGGENGEDRPVQLSVHGWTQEVTVLANSWKRGRAAPTAAQMDTVLLKYDEHGALRWARSYDGGRELDDVAVGLAVDADGTYLAATSQSESAAGREQDFLLCKYGPGGRLLWSRRYGERNQVDDVARALCGVPGGVVVVGEGAALPGTPEAGRVGCLTALFDPGGERLWVRSMAGDPRPIHRVWAAGHAFAGGLYVTGQARSDDGGPELYRTVLRDLSGGTLWTHDWGRIPALSWRDGGAAMALDHRGGAYVAANAMHPDRSPSTFQDFLVGGVTASGKPRWRHEYDAARRRDAPSAIAMAGDGVVVTGQSFDAGEVGSILAIKYSP